jgi:4-hydroxy-3-polyprenylbenzoate decarboxylase
MPYKDLREWLRNVEERGELKKFSGASWDLEMSSMSDMLQKRQKHLMPAVLFDDVPGFPKGFRTLFALTSSAWRIAHTLGLPEDQIDRVSLVKNWRDKRRNMKLIPPRMVKTGPVQENVDTGNDIDLYKFPVPKCHDLDGGRYIGTVCSMVQKDPDQGWVNLGTYRGMVVDRNHIAFHAVEAQHGRAIANKYFSRGQTMPIAVAIGVDPALYCASSQPMTGWGASEYDFAGGVKGQPLEVFEGLTGLPLPAHCEIIIEGECRPGEFVDEGPFGEFHGYYANLGMKPVKEPLVHVKAVYYRNNPILTCSSPSIPPHDTSLASAIMKSMGIWDKLEAMGVPGVRGVWCHEFASGWYFNVVSIEQSYTGHPRVVGNIAALSNTHSGRYTVVVEEDIDPADIEQELWAVVTRRRPHEAIEILTRCPATSTDPAIPLEEKLKYEILPKPMYSSRVVIDGCRPYEHKKDWYPIATVSPELRASLTKRFPDFFK